MIGCMLWMSLVGVSAGRARTPGAREAAFGTAHAARTGSGVVVGEAGNDGGGER
jgi:hypothetical protein